MIHPNVFLGLYNPKTAANVGGVLRAAGCYKVDGVYYTGTRYERAARFSTDTKNAIERVPLIQVNDLFSVVESDVAVVCVELALGATPLPEFTHPEKAMYIFGPEDGTLPQTVIDQAQATVFVPTIGCMNLAASVNVLLYDRLSKTEKGLQYDQLIKKSRDTNNRIRVRRT